MNEGHTGTFMAQELGIPKGKIFTWIKQGHFNHLGVMRNRTFKFYDFDKSVEAILELAKKEESPREYDIFDEIDDGDEETIAILQKKEELKSLVIKNRMHSQEYILQSEHQRALIDLAHVIREHFEGLPSRLTATIGDSSFERDVHKFCVKELETLHLKVRKIA